MKEIIISVFNPLSANPTKWLNTPKQFVGKSRRIVLSVFDQFGGLALKGLKNYYTQLTGYTLEQFFLASTPAGNILLLTLLVSSGIQLQILDSVNARQTST